MVGIIIAAVVSLVLGAGIGALVFYLVQKNKNGSAQNQAKKLVEDALAEASNYKKEAMIEAKVRDYVKTKAE